MLWIPNGLAEVLEIVAVLAAGEGGAVFVDAFEFTVADDFSIGVIELQRAEQGDESCTLGRGAGVGSTAMFVETALVTDADRVGVVMPGVSADHLFRATDVKLAITGDVVVVATAVPAFGTVHLVKELERQMFVRTGG